ncbi:MAG TPA: hypothetical protein VEH05_05975 [Streptosporangiaceae bacterium]|nr:hypothetical protein [Streptosporangiaceae bacterium]
MAELTFGQQAEVCLGPLAHVAVGPQLSASGHAHLRPIVRTRYIAIAPG